MLLCWACHTTVDTGPHSAVLVNMRAYRDHLLAIIATDRFAYNETHIWIIGEEPDMSVIQSLFAKYTVKLET